MCKIDKLGLVVDSVKSIVRNLPPVKLNYQLATTVWCMDLNVTHVEALELGQGSLLIGWGYVENKSAAVGLALAVYSDTSQDELAVKNVGGFMHT